MFHRDNTYEEILSVPEFADLRDYLFYADSNTLLETSSDKQIWEDIPSTWNPDDMVRGFKRILELKRKGVSVLHQIYSEGELQSDPEKRMTGLLWFPVQEQGSFAIVCAGGAYVNVATNVEAFPVASRLNELGISAFVLKYRTNVVETSRKADEDLQAAVKYIMEHKDIFHVTDDYAVYGFSAGGHLAAGFGTENRGYQKAGLPAPKMLGLAYPCVCLQRGNESLSIFLNTMIREGWTKEERDEFDILMHIDNNYPATYIWQTVEDEIIPYELNFKPMVALLEENHIPFKAKSVAHGFHGLGLGNESEAQGWLDESVAFWKSL